MNRGPVQPREGFTGLPNVILARVIAELTPDQLRLFLGLVYGAEFKREGSISPDGRWRVGFGQVLVGLDSAAAAYAMKRDAVRRALRRFEGVAVATLAAASPATQVATSGATPPTLVDFGSWFGIPATVSEAATPPATPPDTAPATPPATIQHKNTRTPNTKKRSSAAASGDAPSEHRLMQVGLEEAFLAERGVPYGFQGGKDGKAISELLRLAKGDRNEVIRRWYRALRLGSKYPGTSTIAGLPGKWNELVDTMPQKGMAPPSTDWPIEEREVRLDEPVLWRKVLEAHRALPFDQQWNGLAEVQGRDDGRGGLVVLVESRARAEGLTAMGRAAWLSGLAGGAPVRFDARPRAGARGQDIRFGSAAPSPHEAFGQGGERAIE